MRRTGDTSLAWESGIAGRCEVLRMAMKNKLLSQKNKGILPPRKGYYVETI